MTMASSIKLKRVFFYLYWIIFSLDHFEKIISYTQKYLKRKFFHRIKKDFFYIYRKKKNNNLQYFFIDNKKKVCKRETNSETTVSLKKSSTIEVQWDSNQFEPVRNDSYRHPCQISPIFPLSREENFYFFPLNKPNNSFFLRTTRQVNTHVFAIPPLEFYSTNFISKKWGKKNLPPFEIIKFVIYPFFVF